MAIQPQSSSQRFKGIFQAFRVVFLNRRAAKAGSGIKIAPPPEKPRQSLASIDDVIRSAQTPPPR
jgi:hypothetical protein